MMLFKAAMLFLILITPVGSIRPQASRVATETAGAEREACREALVNRDRSRAKRVADSAEAAYRKLIKAAPNDPMPRVGLARVLGECHMNLVGDMEKGNLFAAGRELLLKTLALDSTHWEARFTLAQFYNRAPAFMGYRKNAIRELETLIQQQRERTDFPEMASPFVILGDLYKKEKRHQDATSVWERGQRLFPSDSRFRERLRSGSGAIE